jgi:sec-independent protein translocase protein TatA
MVFDGKDPTRPQRTALSPTVLKVDIMSLGMPEIILIFLVVLLVFGAKRIPEIARGLGKGIREFKDATTDIKNELNVDDSLNQIQQPRRPQHRTAPRTDTYAPSSSGQEAPRKAAAPEGSDQQ